MPAEEEQFTFPEPEQTSTIDCPLGSVETDSMCVECSKGTFANQLTGTCELCPIDTYSDTTGSSSCQPCEASLKTTSIGSSQCTGVHLDSRYLYEMKHSYKTKSFLQCYSIFHTLSQFYTT